MPGKDNPKNGSVMNPRFLDGKPAGAKLTDMRRRYSLAESIIGSRQPWFAGAYVNRIWGEFMGQSFYMPIDDMGPSKEAVMPEVLARIAGSFRGSDYDVKKLLRKIVNEPGVSTADEARRERRSPSVVCREQSDAVASRHSLAIAGQHARPDRRRIRFCAKSRQGPFARLGGFEQLFKREFSFDPSTKPEDVEGSISQALMLMNNPQINQKIQARGENVLAKILAEHANDDDALKMVYLRTLARRPSDREFQRCRDYIRTVGNRSEAFEDIMWTLINSTEYQTRR